VGTIVGSIIAAIIIAHIPASGKKCVMEVSMDISMPDIGSLDISMPDVELPIDIRPSKSIFIDRLIE
jgi:hypothetical protein